jgi:hypothetical protein
MTYARRRLNELIGEIVWHERKAQRCAAAAARWARKATGARPELARLAGIEWAGARLHLDSAEALRAVALAWSR